MFSCVWLLLCSLSLVKLHHIAQPKVVRGAECQHSDLLIISQYFKTTTIDRSNSTEVQYCKTSISNKPNEGNSLIDLSDVIYLYKSLAYANLYTYIDPHGPVTQDGVLSINDYQELPLYQIADIRRHHLPIPNSYPEVDSPKDGRLDWMGRLQTDDPGYLLAHSLGGSSRALNIVPMAQNLSRRLGAESKNLGIPRSNWRSHEDWIRRFLLYAYPNGRVTWRTAVQYEDDVIIHPEKFSSFRPVRFTLQYTAYTNQNDDDSVYYDSSQITFLNDNEHSCGDEHSEHHENQIQCDIKKSDGPSRMFGSLNEGSWQTKHQSSFPFTIQGKTYFYGQSFDGFWFIQELLPNGKMGEKFSSQVPWLNYPVVFPFFINGRHFFYGHSSEKRNWFIRELLPGGKMGEETSQGKWQSRHQVTFPFTIDGKQYFYGQSILDGRRWFIQELLPGGKMGEEKSHGTWNENYPIVFPFSIYGRQYFYGHSTEKLTWFIQELLPGGQMGEETSSGTWETRHTVSVAYHINGKHYYFGHRAGDNHWWIQELLPNGKIGEWSMGFLDDEYSIVFPYLINGDHYLYGHSTKTMKWFIRQLL